MVYYDRIDVSEEIYFNQMSASKEWDIGCNFQPNVCNGCHDLLMMSIYLSDFAILSIKCADYHCVINGISKSEAINLLQNIDLTEESVTLSNIKNYYRI